MQDISDVEISGLRIESAGGDGLDITGHVTNITIRKLHAIDGYRQGMSLISATNLLVEDCTFAGTKGTPPESGIDFEPDYSGDRLVNISLVRVRTVGNHGSGISIWPGNLRRDQCALLPPPAGISVACVCV